jgi:hypothetical protein
MYKEKENNMNEFWQTSIGPVVGTPDEAFTKGLEVIPHGSKALGIVVSAKFDQDFMGNTIVRIEWQLTNGEFAKRQIKQNIKIYDKDENKRATALNMLMLMFRVFCIPLDMSRAPIDGDLAQFVHKQAGIKIDEYYTTKNDGKILHGNYVSEVHPVDGFEVMTGKPKKAPESVRNQQSNQAVADQAIVDDDVAF